MFSWHYIYILRAPRERVETKANLVTPLATKLYPLDRGLQNLKNLVSEDRNNAKDTGETLIVLETWGHETRAYGLWSHNEVWLVKIGRKKNTLCAVGLLEKI